MGPVIPATAQNPASLVYGSAALVASLREFTTAASPRFQQFTSYNPSASLERGGVFCSGKGCIHNITRKPRRAPPMTSIAVACLELPGRRLQRDSQCVFHNIPNTF